MIKEILNLANVKDLSKKEQKNIVAGKIPSGCLEWDPIKRICSEWDSNFFIQK